MIEVDFLLSMEESKILQNIERNIIRYYRHTTGKTLDVTAVLKNQNQLVDYLEKIEQIRSSMLLLAAEATILNVEKGMLDRFVKIERKAGREISHEVKVDLSSLMIGFDEIRRAANVFALRKKYGEAAYQDISEGSRREKDLDSHMTANDVLRQSTKSHAIRLENMARGASKTELGRKEQFVIGKRRQNMLTCQELYKAQQRAFVENRSKPRLAD